MENKKTECVNEEREFSVQNSNISGSSFINIFGQGLHFENVNLSETKITDADLSDLQIDGAQIGGASFKNIGMPPECHPMYDPNNTVQRPVTFENCDLNRSKITNCNLSNVEIDGCNLSGLKINGILIEELLQQKTKE